MAFPMTTPQVPVYGMVSVLKHIVFHTSRKRRHISQPLLTDIKCVTNCALQLICQGNVATDPQIVELCDAANTSAEHTLTL